MLFYYSFTFRERKTSIKTFRSPFLSNFELMSSGSRAMRYYHIGKIKIFKNNNPLSRVGSNPQPSRLQSHVCTVAPRRPYFNNSIIFTDTN